jgi:hypothetical protein
MLLYQGGKKEQRIVSSQATFYQARFGKIEYLLAVTPIPAANDEDWIYKDGGIWNGGYSMVTLLNLSQKTYFIAADGPPLGWEYIAEKYRLGEEEAVGLAVILGNLLDRDVRIPEEGLTERCFRVIAGGAV